MNTNIQNVEKEKEYQEIQNNATRSGHLAGIDTHVSKDAKEAMENSGNAPLMGNKTTATPGLGNGVEGTGMDIKQKSNASNNPVNIMEDCGCEDFDKKL